LIGMPLAAARIRSISLPSGSRSDSVDQFALFKTAAGVDQPASLVIV